MPAGTPAKYSLGLPARFKSLKNVAPADVYTGRGQTILLDREKIKRRTMKLRCLQHAEAISLVEFRFKAFK